MSHLLVELVKLDLNEEEGYENNFFLMQIGNYLGELKRKLFFLSIAV